MFINRHLPRRWFRYWTKRVHVDPFLVTHEIVEKTLLDQLRLHYLHAHQVALRTEQAAVEAPGVSWSAYERFMKKHEKEIERERLQRVPPSPDLTPYRDLKDFKLLKDLVARKRHRWRG